MTGSRFACPMCAPQSKSFCAVLADLTLFTTGVSPCMARSGCILGTWIPRLWMQGDAVGRSMIGFGA